MSLSVNIQHALPGFTVNAAFDAGPGVTAIFGKSGAGKSTVINAVAGLIRPQGGHIRLNGSVLFGPGRCVAPHRRRMGYVFQDARLFPHLSVEANLGYGARFTKGPAIATRKDIAALLGLDHLMQRMPGNLSGGERQRVAIARALLSAPALLLMDEPLASLDLQRKAEILPYLDRLKTQGGIPILYVSHSVDEVARLADQIVVLDAGKVVLSGSVFDVLSDPMAVPLVGARAAGAVLTAQVHSHAQDGLSRVTTKAGPLELPGIDAPVGATLRLRIRASDVLIATQPPTGLSARNILPAVITQVQPGHGPGAIVQMRVGDDTILARVTARTAAQMQLEQGQHCFAILKSMSGPGVAAD